MIQLKLCGVSYREDRGRGGAGDSGAGHQLCAPNSWFPVQAACSARKWSEWPYVRLHLGSPTGKYVQMYSYKVEIETPRGRKSHGEKMATSLKGFSKLFFPPAWPISTSSWEWVFETSRERGLDLSTRSIKDTSSTSLYSKINCAQQSIPFTQRVVWVLLPVLPRDSGTSKKRPVSKQGRGKANFYQPHAAAAATRKTLHSDTICLMYLQTFGPCLGQR